MKTQRSSQHYGPFRHYITKCLFREYTIGNQGCTKGKFHTRQAGEQLSVYTRQRRLTLASKVPNVSIFSNSHSPGWRVTLDLHSPMKIYTRHGDMAMLMCTPGLGNAKQHNLR